MANQKTPADQLEDMQSDILLREASDELRREQLEKLWKNYAPYILGGAALILVGLYGNQFLKERAAKQAQRAGDAFATAVQSIADGKTDDARNVLNEMAKTGPPGYAALAKLQAAGAAIKAGKDAEAVVSLDALAGDTGADQLLRDAARLKAASVRVDTADWTEMQNRLTDLMQGTSPWRYSARELYGLAAFKAGRLPDAKQSFQELLSDPKTPPSLSQRAQVVMGQIVAAELQAKFPSPAPASAQPSSMAPATGPVQGTPTVTVPAPAAAPAAGPKKKTP